MLNRIASIVEWARKDVRTIPSTPFHRMIIEGLLALYLSDPKVSGDNWFALYPSV